jgi:hypothetical protein
MQIGKFKPLSDGEIAAAVISTTPPKRGARGSIGRTGAGCGHMVGERQAPDD